MIQATNVSLRFGKKALFEDVNIKFTKGNCYGLIGANGAGKSTFLRILTGELEPTSGEVSVTPGGASVVLKAGSFPVRRLHGAGYGHSGKPQTVRDHEREGCPLREGRLH